MAFLIPYAGKELSSRERLYKLKVSTKNPKSIQTIRSYVAPPKEEIKAIEELIKSDTPKIAAPASLKKIFYEVCRKYDHHPGDVVSISRVFTHVRTRREFIWRARNETSASFSQIARILKRDHSTVIHAYKMALKEYEKKNQ